MAQIPQEISNRMLTAFNDAVKSENGRIGRNPYADEGHLFSPIKSIGEIDGHPSVTARGDALEELGKAEGYKVQMSGAGQTTGSFYYEFRKSSGIKDADGYDIPLNLNVRVADHPNTSGRREEHINFAPGADTLDEAAQKLRTAHITDPEEPDIIFGK